jgi:hypothetical protein
MQRLRGPKTACSEAQNDQTTYEGKEKKKRGRGGGGKGIKAEKKTKQFSHGSTSAADAHEVRRLGKRSSEGDVADRLSGTQRIAQSQGILHVPAEQRREGKRKQKG